MKSRQPENALHYTGAELSGKAIGILGFGHVGQKVAAYARAFDMQPLVFSRRPIAQEGIRPVDLEQLYAESDIISVHLPLTPDTKHLIRREAFALMKRDALLVNTSRGAIIEEHSLVEALRTRQIGGACLDVFEQEPLPLDHPLREMQNVILTPHTAGLPDGVKFHRKRYDFFIRNINKLLRGEAPECALNRPAAASP